MPSRQTGGESGGPHWRASRERGSRMALRLIMWLALHIGRPLCRVLLVPISAYFLLTSPLARHSSRDFLGRARGRPAGWHHVLRHLHVFATTLLDRVYLIHERADELQVQVSNQDVLEEALRAGRGCLLMGSHLGSFELLGILGSRDRQLKLNVVMHGDQQSQMRELLFRRGRLLPYQVIALGEAGSMLRVKECLERGEVVGMLADRVYGDEPTASLPFLGDDARFSLSPWRLARITGASVVTIYGLFHGGRRYEIVFDRLSPAASATTLDQVNNGRAPTPDLDMLRAYVGGLESQARRLPYNWFNFYAYWNV